MSCWYADLFLLYYRLRVVPLFETVKDLREAGSVIRKLLSIEWYREHIQKNHTGHQEVDILKFQPFPCMEDAPVVRLKRLATSFMCR